MSRPPIRASELQCNALSEADMAEDPFMQFRNWLHDAEQSGMVEPNAMSLATANSQGKVTCRTVLLKAFDASGFVFFTNYTSRKARQIEDNPCVALLFPWLSLERQVEIVGSARRISATESIAYFVSRPFGSRIGAWVSRQSEVIPSRKVLVEKFEQMRRRFAKGKIPKPDAWGGYRVVPESIEFWQAGVHRLHDRFRYTRSHGMAWQLERFSP